MRPVQKSRKLEWHSVDTASAFYKEMGIQLPYKRAYLTIELDSNPVQNKISLDFAQLYMHQIIRRNDTIQGIRFHFGKGAKYEHLIRVLDIFSYESTWCWISFPEDIWFFQMVE
ncbi:hypothetical protein CLV59_108265 [Chitinophaga dinghuensis]|uniref:Uncharacterized protein n=1 Tax=Chitinophaga dinghuensis TaxID=1539050 RepID=A0A327VQM8_9BACT|nr:hypothetical protein [Chitinophaga dinghuensis]RAJ76744.1 hypothetical protein CLV59_108265 [Chitinophaga dinghuensis]